MIDKNAAIEIQRHALKAIESLEAALYAAKNCCPEKDFERIKRGVGLSIGRIDSELLSVIYEVYPELDHVK